jgi:Sec7-like guanine-nucleotide exchange factor
MPNDTERKPQKDIITIKEGNVQLIKIFEILAVFYKRNEYKNSSCSAFIFRVKKKKKKKKKKYESGRNATIDREKDLIF